MKYHTINVSLPDSDSEDYGNFTIDNCVGKKDKPTSFEQRLPSNWEFYSANSRAQIFDVSYIFPDHSDGLSLDETSEILRAAYELGATGFGVRGSRYPISEFKGTDKQS